jgi:hypothetical protein
MSFFALVSGPLVGAPQRRQGARAAFATGSLKVEVGAESMFVSLTAFGAKGDELLAHAAGEPLAVSGRAEVSRWVSRDDAERHGLKLVVEQLLPINPKRQAPSEPRKRSRTQQPPLLDPSSPPPNDRVDDLWPGLAP